MVSTLSALRYLPMDDILNKSSCRQFPLLMVRNLQREEEGILSLRLVLTADVPSRLSLSAIRIVTQEKRKPREWDPCSLRSDAPGDPTMASCPSINKAGVKEHLDLSVLQFILLLVLTTRLSLGTD